MTQATEVIEARVIESDAEAVDTAHKLATGFAATADERDRDRRLPGPELDELSASGLLGITVPRRFGGAGVSVPVLAEVFRVLATADASLAQIPHSHFVFLNALLLQGTDEQQAFFFGEALAGKRFANAQSERGTKTIAEDRTTLTGRADGGYDLEGEKFYCTGALFADWLVVRATLAGEPPLPGGAAVKAIAFIARDTPGVTVQDDWDGMGQRTTASGTTRLDAVRVDAAAVVPYTAIFDRASTYGSRAQVLHAALDVGIARGALDAAVHAVAKSRPWFEAGVERAADDPLVVQQAGELEIVIRGAEALVDAAAQAIDTAETAIGADGAGATDRVDSAAVDAAVENASVATAIAKVAADRASIRVTNELFELGGTRSATGALNLSRYWRDARTHTLHDPARWKVQHVGRWLLDGTPPPRHGLL